MRSPVQGVWNIVRFNWPFYALATLAIAVVLGLRVVVADPYRSYLTWLAAAIAAPVLVSLAVSFYIYDVSALYTLSWLNFVPHNRPLTMVTINAGFDETSGLLQRKFPLAHLRVFDFYDPDLHTEVSIKRARLAYPPYPGTQAISTATIPLPNGVADYVLLILAAHEIRQVSERVCFFGEVSRVLKPSGRIIVAEHLRNPANFLAYTLGFLHFLPRSAWMATFSRADLTVCRQHTITPFITTFILEKDGAAS